MFQDSDSFPAHHSGRRLWPLPSPVAQRHPNQAHRRPPHTMGDAVCAWFGLNPPGGRVVSTPLPNKILSLFLCMHVVDYFVEYIHIFDTLLINYVPKFPPRLPLVGGYQLVRRNWEGDLQSTRLLAPLRKWANSHTSSNRQPMNAYRPPIGQTPPATLHVPPILAGMAVSFI